VHLLQVDVVLDDVQHGGGVFCDADFQQRQDPGAAPQRRDFPYDQLVDVRG